MSRKFLDLPIHKHGYLWENVAPLGEEPLWEERPEPASYEDRLFGYEVQEFMAKQYKRAA